MAETRFGDPPPPWRRRTALAVSLALVAAVAVFAPSGYYQH